MRSKIVPRTATAGLHRENCPPTPWSESRPKPRYEVTGLLREGGMAQVYLANHHGLAGFVKPVAVKKLLPQLERQQCYVEMFLDEARLAARLNHPHIVRCFGLEEIDGSIGLVMEHLDGAGLDTVLTRASRANRRLPVAVVCRLGLDILSALEYLHELTGDQGQPLNIVHRNIAPTNVFVMRNGSATLLDFGIARAATRPAHTAVGCVRGKAGYMAPEQWRGGELDQRVDIWGVGVLLWEALTAKRFIPTGDPLKASAMVLEGRLPPVETLTPDVPPALAAIVGRALQRDPGDRYQSAAIMRHELRQFVDQAQVNVSRDQVAVFLAGRLAGHVARHAPIQARVSASANCVSSSPSHRSVRAAKPPPLPPRTPPISLAEVSLMSSTSASWPYWRGPVFAMIGSTRATWRSWKGPVLAMMGSTKATWRSWKGLVLVLCSLLFGAWLVFDQAWPAEGGRSATIKAAQTIAAPRPRPASPAPAPAEDGQDLQDDHGTVMTWASVE